MKRFFVALLTLGVFALITAAQATCQQQTVWEIGKYDQSNHEFQAAPSKHVVYDVSQGDWAHAWPGEQRAGSVYDIRFGLDAAPRGVYFLKLSLLNSYPRIPALQIQINGHEGRFYLHPKLLYLADQRYRSSEVLKIEFAARYLVEGANDLTLAVVDRAMDHPEPDAPIGTLGYDCISLTNDAHATYPQGVISADVIPTIFYKQSHGSLVELVDAYLRFAQHAPEGRAVLTLNGRSYDASLPAISGFGEERVEFEVPEWRGTAPAQLEVRAGPQRKFDLSLTAARKWAIYMVPHTHVDIGYTDYQGKVAEVHAETLLEAAKLIEEHPDFRFATDGSWNVAQFLATRSKPERDEVLGLVRAGKIGVPADYFNLLTGYASLETLYRSLYYTKSLSTQYGVPFNYATTTDVPTYTWAYPSVLASAGIKYWAVGGNQDRAPVLAAEQWNEKSPFWWEGPDGKKVLFWYSRGYAQIGAVFGVNPQEATIRESLPVFLEQYEGPQYKPNAALIYGAQAENTILHPQVAAFAPVWNQLYAYPKLEYSTFADFFNYVDQHYGSELPTYKGDMGPYWEDGVGSDAYYTAEDRQNQSEALSVQTISTVDDALNPNYHRPRPEMEAAWNNIMAYAEHTWGAGNSISQPDSEEASGQLAIKDNYATQARFELDDIRERAFEQLQSQIHIPANTLVVFNPLNWKRDALVDTDLGNNQELVDLSTGQVVPLETVWDKDNFVHVRFLARDLPPVGYKCYAVRSASGAAAPPQAYTNPVIENQYYRITIDARSGAVASIFDKQLGKDLVDPDSPYKFGQYLYVTGGDGMTRMVHAFKTLPLGKLTIHPATDGQYLGSVKTPWGYAIKLRGSDVNTPAIDLEILLFDNQKKIEFQYTVHKTYTTDKEGVYFAFPTAVTSPEFAYGIQQGWVNPAHDMLRGASLEWFSIQKWMAVHGAGMTVGIVPLDAPLASFGDINRGLWPTEFHPKTSTLFSYAMNNYWHTNYRAGQGGTFTFRYVLTSANRFDPAALSRLGWESMEPPVLDRVTGQEKIGDPDEPLPAQGTSLLDIDNPNVVLVTWKLAEGGKGTILRLKEIAGQDEETTVSLPQGTIHSASLCDAVEDDLRPLDVTGNAIHLTFHPYEVLTVRLIP